MHSLVESRFRFRFRYRVRGRLCSHAFSHSLLVLAAALGACSTPLPPERVPTTVSTPVPVARVIEAAASAPPPAPGAAMSLPAAPGVAADAAKRLDTASNQLLAYADRLRELGPAELAREQVRLSEFGDEPANRLQLVLLLAFTRQNSDLPRAMNLLEPLTRPGTASPWRGLARLLQDRLVEQRRLEEQSERQAQQLREQQRRIDQLSNQLEALKAIERSISGRPPGAALPPASGAFRTPP